MELAGTAIGLMAPTPVARCWMEEADGERGRAASGQSRTSRPGGVAAPGGGTRARLAERLGARRFLVSFVGEFKRGKSTLINALLGAVASHVDECVLAAEVVGDVGVGRPVVLPPVVVEEVPVAVAAPGVEGDRGGEAPVLAAA